MAGIRPDRLILGLEKGGNPPVAAPDAETADPALADHAFGVAHLAATQGANEGKVQFADFRVGYCLFCSQLRKPPFLIAWGFCRSRLRLACSRKVRSRVMAARTSTRASRQVRMASRSMR